ncbi:uncharacterized protein LOC135811991 [Sycon ciliatum]|uniref:uncharacterized protein LOC135811991 n=1 Tax=Sycon ciliatum TaxID=27933 RepID=UPI0031F6F0E2
MNGSGSPPNQRLLQDGDEDEQSASASSGECQAGSTSTPGETRRVRILWVNFCSDMRGAAGEKAKELFCQALKKDGHMAIEWEQFQGTYSVQSIYETADAVMHYAKTSAAVFDTAILGMLMVDDSNRLAVTQDSSQQSNTLKPVYSALRSVSTNGRFMLAVCKDEASRSGASTWQLHSTWVRDALSVRLDDGCLDGDQGLLVSWWKEPLAYQAYKFSRFVLGLGHEEQTGCLLKRRTLKNGGIEFDTPQTVVVEFRILKMLFGCPRTKPRQPSTRCRKSQQGIHTATEEKQTSDSHEGNTRVPDEAGTSLPLDLSILPASAAIEASPSTKPTCESDKKAESNITLHVIHPTKSCSDLLKIQVEHVCTKCVPSYPNDPPLLYHEYSRYKPLDRRFMQGCVPMCDGEDKEHVLFVLQSADELYQRPCTSEELDGLYNGFRKVVLCLAFDKAYLQPGQRPDVPISDKLTATMRGIENARLLVVSWWSVPSQEAVDSIHKHLQK